MTWYALVATALYTVLVVLVALSSSRRGYQRAVRDIESGRLRIDTVRGTRTTTRIRQ